MNSETAKWSRRYQAALCKYLAQGSGASLQPALGLGRQAVALGLKMLDLARIHKQAPMAVVLSDGSSGTRQKIIRRTQRFFAEAVVPIEQTHRDMMKTNVCVNQLAQTLRRRMVESSASTRCLKRNILLRQGAEQSLKKSAKRHAKLLAELRRLQHYLRNLRHTCLSTQEDERRKMSFQLHDEIAQALIAIDLRLLTLKKAAKASTMRLKKEIAKTQRLVKESVKKINKFAHEFGIQQET